MKKLEWRNLQDGYCPKCYQELNDESETPYVTCSSCDFVIGREKYNEILENFAYEDAGNDAENA